MTQLPPPVVLNSARRVENETAVFSGPEIGTNYRPTAAPAPPSVSEEDAAEQEEVLDEQALIEGIVTAATTRTDRLVRVPVHRTINGKRTKVLEFVIHPLTPEEYQGALDECTEKVRQNGTVRRGETDSLRLQNMLIYFATVGDPGKKIWDRTEIKRALSQRGIVCMNGEEVVGATFNIGEKVALVNKIDEISGFGGGDLEGKDVTARLKKQ